MHYDSQLPRQRVFNLAEINTYRLVTVDCLVSLPLAITTSTTRLTRTRLPVHDTAPYRQGHKTSFVSYRLKYWTCPILITSGSLGARNRLVPYALVPRGPKSEAVHVQARHAAQSKRCPNQCKPLYHAPHVPRERQHHVGSAGGENRSATKASRAVTVRGGSRRRCVSTSQATGASNAGCITTTKAVTRRHRTYPSHVNQGGPVPWRYPNGPPLPSPCPVSTARSPSTAPYPSTRRSPHHGATVAARRWGILPRAGQGSMCWASPRRHLHPANTPGAPT
ncbi:hypothetical protein BT67DRAFT_165948 [Trichocladium antarcticum]|uniref:Uncharacterized protein n=1 Tax=Trichocladium antarcticum TaxID=1450529 RepID=A0AAN6UE00_9PEZI|nr:hypothetical protein BT67DRAFT_165948 [Trichocladium antarcticum]